MLKSRRKDDNNHKCPLCFRIGDSKNDSSWEWFLIKLYEVIKDVDDLVMVLDHHNNIEKVAQKVFPHVSHGVCSYCTK